MGKNEQRAHDIVQEYEVMQNVGDLIHYPQLQLNRLRTLIAVALDKEKRRGRRKANKYLQDRVSLMLDEKSIAGFCEKHAPKPQFDAEKVRRLVHLYGNARFNEGAYWKSDNESARKRSDYAGENIKNDILAAITGSAKPQFDAEKVKIMLGFLRKNTYAAGKYNHPIDNNASELVYRNILKALHIE